MATTDRERRRLIPSVDALLRSPEIAALAKGVPRTVLVAAVRAAAAAVREVSRAGSAESSDAAPVAAQIAMLARRHAALAMGPHYRKAINAAGIILHTGLGRAVLAPTAIRRILDELSGYSILQLDVETGKRDQRDGRIEWLLQRLTGAAAATVVNNNAAATMIVLNTVAAGREVIVSRGQLVEIGGSFRLPEVMAASGAQLVEVGATNKTHLRDYEGAITENTAAILRVHPSNYKIVGFASDVPLAELEQLAHSRGLVLIDDVGAGPLIDLAPFGLDPEPTLPESVRLGADLITASADKLIGAGQGGIILGNADLIKAIRRNPLARIVRVGKLTLATLEATLTLFLDESVALREVPTLAMLCRPLADIREQAKRIAGALGQACSVAQLSILEGFSQMGSGSLPGQDLPTCLVAVSGDWGAADLAQRLRRRCPAVFTRIRKDAVLLDPRTLLDDEEALLIDALTEELQTEAP